MIINNKEHTMNHFSETKRIELRDATDFHYKQWLALWDDIIESMTFKQYHKLPAQVAIPVRLAAIKRVTKSRKLHVKAELCLEAWNAYISYKDAYSEYLKLDVKEPLVLKAIV